MKKTVKALLAMVMAVIMVISAIPVSAAETRSVSSNFDAVVKHINSHPDAYTEEDGYKSLGFYVKEDGNEAVWYIWNQSNGIKFGTIISGSEGNEAGIVQTEFLLRKNYNTVNVTFQMLYVVNEQLYDMVDATKSFNRTTIKATTEYTSLPGSENGRITSEEIKEAYNASLQNICMFWNAYFLNALGFGLKGLGFTAYECPHTYVNDCDTTCDICGAEREITHGFGAWQKVDDDSHSRACGVCGETETAGHIWSVKEIVQMPTEEVPGLIAYVCKDCGAEKTVEADFIPGDVDMNGAVNNKDVEYLLWYTLFPESYPLHIEADFTGDGSVNNKDVEYLLWHTLFPETYPIA